MIARLDRGRDAVRRHLWADAVDALTAADREEGLAPDDLELLGIAAWWAGRPDEATDALERAFGGYQDAGRAEDAARVAIGLAYEAYRRLANAVGAGWQARAERLLAPLPESPLHALVAAYDAIAMLQSGHLDEGIARADEAVQVAAELHNEDALYFAMAIKGMAQAMAGEWRSGLALMDEAAAAASTGSLSLRAASDIYCLTIGACRNVGDIERAGQWAEESERWMRRNGAGGYPGICRVHRAEIKMLHGRWAEAEHEAREACEELERYRLIDGAGSAWNAVGEIRLRMGDLDAAAEAFDRAYEKGHDAQPGLSLLLLARGEVGEAQRSIARAIATASGTGHLSDRAAHSRLLPAEVEIALAARDFVTAGRAVDQLEAIAADFERPILRAGALTARGELLLGEDKPAEASPILGQSWRLWQTNDLPYEAARARLQYAKALTAEGELSSARRDLLAARSAFERLGAVVDVEQIDALLATESSVVTATGPGPTGSQPSVDGPERRATKTFMFTDIVTSTDLVGVIGDDAWNELLEWHDRELRATFSQHRGEVVSHTGDGFFVAFDRAADAVECALDIQRRLLRHRREHGFAPSVRIGLHRAEATRRGRDYSGRGVHVAARIGAAAGPGEILASGGVLEEAGTARFSVSQPRDLTLKGIREPVEARSIEWRQ